MENGNERVDGSVVGEKNRADDGVSGQQEEERVFSGSQMTRDVEDEVFEEAIGTEQRFNVQGTEPALVDEAISIHGDENRSAKTTAVTNSGKVGGSNANAVLDEEPFEEAVGILVDAENQEEVVTPVIARGDSMPSVFLSDKTDEGGTRSGGKEVKHAGFNGETQVSEECGVQEYMRLDNAIVNAGSAEDSGRVVSSGNFDDDEKGQQVIAASERELELSSVHSPENCKKEQFDENSESVVSSKDDSVMFDDATNPEKKLPNLPTSSQPKHLEEKPDAAAHIEFIDVHEEGEKTMNGLVSSGSQDRNKVEDVKDVYVVQDLKYHGGTDGQKHTSSEVYTSAKPVEAAGFRSSSSSVESMSKLNEVSRVIEPNLVNNNHQNTNDKTHVDEEFVVAQEPEQKEQKDQKGKENREFFEDGEVKQQGPSPAISEEPKNRACRDDANRNTELNNRSESKTSTLVAASAKSTSSDTSSARPAGLGRAAPLLEPAHRVVQQPRANGTALHTQSQQIDDSSNGEVDEGDETREKLQMIRVKFLRLAHRLGQTPHNVVVAQVLYRLGLAEQLRGRNGGRVGAFSFDRASAMAEQLEAAGSEPLDFSCTIMVLGKSGVGKSATINSIFDEVKFGTDAFQTGTKKVQDVVGTVHGIKVRVIDTPGLLPSWSDQHKNGKILNSVKQFIKKTPPDIVLYLDRLDVQSRDFGDMPLLRTITEVFGPAIWFNAIVVLTHAASAPPDGPNGTASSYDMFVTQRSHAVQDAIRQAAGDMRLMNPVSLVENHSACRTNRAGQRVLPNGQVWKPHLLLLSFASKILAEANMLLKLQDTPPGKPFVPRSRTPPLPFLLSSLLQSRPQVKLPEEQLDNEDGMEDDLDDSSDEEDGSEYDELPPFRCLTKEQISGLSKAQQKAYYDELEYREKLFMRKQLKEERKQRRMMKRMAAEAKDLPNEYSENTEEESGAAASVPVPMPDLALPASFDSDNPTHRYRCLDTSNQWLVRAVLDNPGWDHDVGYEGINVERLFVVKDKVPVSFSGQITKDKKDATVQLELASSLKHGEGKATSLGFDLQTVGKDLAYTLRSEMRFSNYRRNKATAGVSCTLIGDALLAGVKVEDKLIASRRFQVVMAGGLMTGRGDIAYGGSLEAQLKDKDFPMGRSLSTLGISVMDWHGDLAVGCNIQSQLPIGRHTNLIARGNLNNRGAGQVSLRINSSEQLQVALIGLIPLLKKLLSGYPQQVQF